MQQEVEAFYYRSYLKCVRGLLQTRSTAEKKMRAPFTQTADAASCGPSRLASFRERAGAWLIHASLEQMGAEFLNKEKDFCFMR